MLDSRLREFHKFDNLEIELPAKQRNIFKNSQNLEFYRSIKNDFAKYLQVRNLHLNKTIELEILFLAFIEQSNSITK